MTNCLKRYWFEFDYPKARLSFYGYIPIGDCCGITAYDYDDAIKIMHRFILRENEKPIFKRVVENVDISALEDENVKYNSGVPIWRGVWYPAYNLWYGAYSD